MGAGSKDIIAVIIWEMQKKRLAVEQHMVRKNGASEIYVFSCHVFVNVESNRFIITTLCSYRQF